MEETLRFLEMLQLIHKHDCRYQRKQEDFAADLGVTVNTLRSITERATDLGLISIITSGRLGGGGRWPNIYVLLVAPDDWLARRSSIVEARRAEVEKRRQATASRREHAREQLRKMLAGDILGP